MPTHKNLNTENAEERDAGRTYQRMAGWKGSAQCTIMESPREVLRFVMRSYKKIPARKFLVGASLIPHQCGGLRLKFHPSVSINLRFVDRRFNQMDSRSARDRAHTATSTCTPAITGFDPP